MSRWALFKPVKVRAVDGQLLIKRIRVIQTPVFELLIHRLQTADSDVDLHTHPWRIQPWLYHFKDCCIPQPVSPRRGSDRFLNLTQGLPPQARLFRALALWGIVKTGCSKT